MVDKLLNKSSTARPSMQEILNLDIMKEKMKLYGYTMPGQDELRLQNARDKDMQKMVANQQKSQRAQTTDQKAAQQKPALHDLLNNKPPAYKKLDPSNAQQAPPFIVAPQKPKVAPPQEAKNYGVIAAAAKAQAKGENVRRSNAKPLPQISEEETIQVKEKPRGDPVLHFKEKPPVP